MVTNIIERLRTVAGEDFDSRECRVTNPRITARESIVIADHIVALEAEVGMLRSVAEELRLKYETEEENAKQQRDMKAKARSERDALAAELEILSAFRDEVVGVMNNSQGVAGWHLNHTIATWDELFPVVPDTESPAACLAQVKADALMEYLATLQPVHPAQTWLEIHLTQYASRIRQGEVE